MRTRLLPVVLCASLMSGCGLDKIDLSEVDFGIGDDTGDNIVLASARDFVTCNLGKECTYLWEQAEVWLEENARFRVQQKNESTLTAYNDVPDKHRQEFQYRVTRIPLAGGIAKLNVEAFCSDVEACEDTVVEQVHKINEYLRAHKRALNQGQIEQEGYEEPELPQREPTTSTPTELDDISIDQEYQQGRFQAQAERSLAGAGCLKQSKMALLKSGSGEDLYEVDCLTGIRRVVFRCTQDGCSVLE